MEGPWLTLQHLETGLSLEAQGLFDKVRAVPEPGGRNQSFYLVLTFSEFGSESRLHLETSRKFCNVRSIDEDDLIRLGTLSQVLLAGNKRTGLR